MPEVDKVKLADFVIQNNTDLETLKGIYSSSYRRVKTNGFVNYNFKKRKP